jgi:tetratricopeptide (TPR) repeat protein
MARNVLIVCSALLLLAFSGCSPGGPMVSVLRGNVAYSRGDFQTALVHYLATEEEAEDRGWLLFNVGNVYYAMGEQEAALAAWNDARTTLGSTTRDDFDSRQTTLVHAASYNRGVLLFQQGRFSDARDEFRYALEVNSRSMSAKRNLELTLERLESAEKATEPRETRGDGAPESTDDEQTIRILEYVRRKEAQRWFANREDEESQTVRDW